MFEPELQVQLQEHAPPEEVQTLEPSNIQSQSIDHVSFRLLSEQDIQKLSVVQILYQKPFVHGKIKEHGLHDLRMGATTQFDPCQTCHEGIETCNGHFGHIALTYPIYHALCFKNLVKVLNCVCFSCFNLVVDIDQTSMMAQELKTKTKSKRKIRQDQFEDLDFMGGGGGGVCGTGTGDSTLDFLFTQSKHKSKCEQCGFPKHKVELRKLDLKIVWKAPAAHTKTNEPKAIFTNADDQAYAALLSNHFDAAFILFCLRQLPKNLREWILGPLDASCFVLMNVLVPPSITRPYTSQGKSMGINELTSKLDEIVGSNVSLFNQTNPVWLQFLHKILSIDFDCTRFPPDWVFFETWCEYNQIVPAVMNILFQYSVDLQTWKQMSRSLCMRQYVFYWNGLRSAIVTSKWLEQYMSLKYHGSVFLDNGLRMHKPEKKTVRTNAFAKGIVQRLKGKYGRFRWNLLGKRVNQCARSVVVPEAYIDIDELAMPLFIAKQLTIPETVQTYNRAKLQQLIMNGSTKWPGSNSVLKCGGGDGVDGSDGAGNKEIELELLSRAERELLAKELQLGDKVLRHLQDGDVCLFNRQPSLHRPSIMGHRVRVMSNGKGIGLHECVTHPYNADFDGDEMNVHQPQSLEARAEVQEFMMVDKQYANHQTIGVTFGMKQNPLLALSLLSSPDVWIAKDEMMQYATLLNSMELPEPALVAPQPLWTGRQLLCMALPTELDYSNGDVCIRDKEWLCGLGALGEGQLNKKHLGAGQGQLFHVLLHQLGSSVVKRVFSDLHRLGSEWLLHHGFSVGLSDCVVGEGGDTETSTNTMKRDQMLDIVQETLRNHEKKMPEAKTNHFLNTLLSFMQPSTSQPDNVNRIRTMVSCGSKGNMNNLTQITCMLGQQTIDGKRISKPFHPTLKAERTARHSGLVTHSYFEGLTTSEFYMHCAAGRKGLVDTAVATASTGYAQRRVVKILESIFLTADGFVRTTDQQIVNVSYGICNLDVSVLQPYRLRTNLELAPDLWKTLLPSAKLIKLNNVLAQQIFLGQNVVRSCSRHVHETSIKTNAMVIEIPFDIEFVWKRFLNEYPYDPNPQEMNLDAVFEQWDKQSTTPMRYFVLKVLLADWFGSKHPYRDDFMELAKQLYEQGFVPPGEAVGGVASESIGEPMTQMTLNTFHYAGVSQQNVTNGIPRLKEICSVQKQIKTPMILAHLLPSKVLELEQLEHWSETLVERKMHYFIRRIHIDTPSICIEFNHERMIRHRVSPFTFAQLLRVYLTDMNIKTIDVSDGKRKRQPFEISIGFVYSPSARIELRVQCRPFITEIIQQIVQATRTTWTMTGIRGVESAHTYLVDEQKDSLVTMVGSNDMTMHDVWDVYPVDFRQTFTNNIVEVESLLGIDASKYVLFKEMKAALSLEGTVVHDNHIRLLVDVMTCTGKLLPTDRNGLEEFAPDNILTRASFEKNTDVLRQASICHREQSLNGISEAIMVGSDLSLGTGASKMVSIAQDSKNDEMDIGKASMVVTTHDWDDFVETSWEPYFQLMDDIRTNVCLQIRFLTSVPHLAQTQSQLQQSQIQATTAPDTYLTRKRKQKDVVHYRPSSPKLVDSAVRFVQSINESNVGNVEDESSSNANNGSKSASDSTPALTLDNTSPLTLDSLSAVMQSVATLQSTRTSEALGLMQSLLSQSLVNAFESS